MITEALQAYADRGVFRGFRATPGARAQYQFLWLTQRPVTAVFDSRRRRLSFPSLLPAIDKASAADVKALVTSRTGRGLPDHKRLDARRARVSGTLRKGDFSLAVTIRGHNHSYAVKAALNLINDIFVTLHERHPDYLIEQFGMSAE